MKTKAKAPFQYLVMTQIDASIFDRISHQERSTYFESACSDNAVAKRCTEACARSRNGDWQHNVDLATVGLSVEDADEVFYSRYHHREAEFD